MDINIETIEAKMTALKLNTEGSVDNPTNRSDLSFECLAGGELANILVGCDVSLLYWDKDNCIKQLGIKHIVSEAELKNATMEFGKLKVMDVKVRKLQFKPIGGRQLILNLVVQVHHTGQELMKFDKLLMTSDVLKLYSAQDDMFPMADNDPD